MIQSVQFRNFKALKDTALPLGPFTLFIGPNGSGKSTAIQGLREAAFPASDRLHDIASAGSNLVKEVVEVILHFAGPFEGISRRVSWTISNTRVDDKGPVSDEIAGKINTMLTRLRVYSLNPNAIAAAVPLNPSLELNNEGGYLAAVLDQLRDNEPERFEDLNKELGRWLPEFDRILFETPTPGHRGILLRTRQGQHPIPARNLSQGTLLSLAILTLAHLPHPPSIVCLEEPDRGIHPRLLREVQDALYRLSYPESHGENRDGVQVVVTTHSPYFLDLYKNHPEQVVIAQKIGDEVHFDRLSDLPHVEEILQGASLGDIWYSGILGGVPCER